MADEWRPRTLSTPRLILRAVDESDLGAIFAYASNPNVTRYTLFETHQSLDDTRAFLRDHVWPSYARQIPSPMGICLRDNPGWLIGTLGCSWNTLANKTMELGYALAEESWGRGIAAEAARSLVDHLFATFPELVRVQAHCMAENAASARVMEKIGMSFEGRLRQATFRRGRSWDMLIYSVLRSERRL
jgi:ribosomal-protein-alanine N-acetyltransferase